MRTYDCLKGECPPIAKQKYEGGQRTVGERLTICYRVGDYEMTSREAGSSQFSTVMGKGCPID
jgi:hypothetical protein